MFYYDPKCSSAAGFDIRTPVRVRVMHGCVVLTWRKPETTKRPSINGGTIEGQLTMSVSADKRINGNRLRYYSAIGVPEDFFLRTLDTVHNVAVEPPIVPTPLRIAARYSQQ